MNLLWFADLGHLAKTGSFSQAAELSHISQPAFSRRIKSIEDWVGAALVDRSRHPVTLTSAGTQMLEAGQQALFRLEAERRQIREAQAAPDSYVITFGAQHSIGWRFFPAWLQGFENDFGPIVSRLRADNLPSCVSDLQQRVVDFVIAYESANARAIERRNGVESLLIGGDVLTPVCKPTRDRRPLFALDEGASDVPYLRFGDDAPIGAHLEPLLEARGLKRRLRVFYENSMSSALRIRAREGHGVAWLPLSVVRPDLDAGVLVRLEDRDLDVDLDIRLFRRRQHGNALTHAVWTYLAMRDPARSDIAF